MLGAQLWAPCEPTGALLHYNTAILPITTPRYCPLQHCNTAHDKDCETWEQDRGCRGSSFNYFNIVVFVVFSLFPLYIICFTYANSCQRPVKTEIKLIQTG
jgi:hypothetical protein